MNQFANKPSQLKSGAVDLLGDSLNEEQRTAVAAPEGPVLVVAGAGSGKTRVLTHRIAFLLASRRAQVGSVLAITFTNKAAAEMLQRVEALLGSRLAGSMWIRTFHSACARILREQAALLGFTSNFSIYDEADSINLVKSCLRDLGYDPKRVVPGRVRHLLSAAKNELVSPEAFQAGLEDGLPFDLGEIAAEYGRRLRESNAMDFDDLVVNTVRLLSEHPAVRAGYEQRFRYLLIDEFQDTNPAQWELVRLLGSTHRNVFCVGDHDQSIYRFRGADYRNLERFLDQFPDAKLIKLEQNYRSTQVILDAANAVISKNSSRVPKRLWTSRSGGEKIAVYEALSEQDEASYIASSITKLVEEAEASYGDVAVFYRTNAQSRAIEEVFVREDIPYRVVGNVRFYERKEIKDVTAYLRILVNPSDDTSLMRIINVPRRGIGAGTVEKLRRAASESGIPVAEMVRRLGGDGGDNPSSVVAADLAGSARERVSVFGKLLASLLETAERAERVEDIVAAVLSETGMIDDYEAEGTPQALSRIENLEEFVGVASRFDEMADAGQLGEETWAGESAGLNRLAVFLEQVSLVSDSDDVESDSSAVQLMTVHNAKGLEFPVVFVAGMEEGIFPHARSMLEADDLEEERRLCYVAISRAADRLYLTYALSRSLYGSIMQNPPSRFLAELPESTIARQRFYADDRPPVAVGVSDEISRRRSSRSSLVDLQTGDDVVHAKYGEGVVVGYSGSGEAAEVVVRFPGIGEKRLLLEWAPLQKKVR
jgi:DNA helicase-2/ATP-dependent DNA helicase PcrA